MLASLLSKSATDLLAPEFYPAILFPPRQRIGVGEEAALNPE
jgi:hypothetical protein